MIKQVDANKSVRTRKNGVYVPGLYNKFLYPSYKMQNIKRIKFKKNQFKSLDIFSDFSHQLKYLVLSQLKSKKMMKHGKLILTSKMLNFLKQKYGFNSVFKSCIKILEDFNITRICFLNDRDYCKIISFYARIYQPRKISFLDEQIASAPYFSFKFLKGNEVL